MGRRPLTPLAAIALIVLASLAACAAAGLPFPSASSAPIPPMAGPVRTSAVSGAYFDHAVVVVMENHAICDILTSCGGAGVYETALANASASATGYTDCVDGSLSDYFCLTAATTFGCGGYSGNPLSNNCTWAAWNATNLVDLLVGKGLTWEAFMEGMPKDCYQADSGLYVVRHDPFVYYGDIANNATRCALVAPAGTNDTAFLATLNETTTAPNFLWLTPNVCDDMHSCSVAAGDAYLAGLVPQILASPLFTTQRAALFLTFDEPTGGLGAPDLYTVWAGPEAQVGYRSAEAFNHTSLIKTLEANWGLASLGREDVGAVNMSTFFATPGVADFSLTASPSSVQFVAGSSGSTSVQATATASFSGSITLTAASSPGGVGVSCSPTSITGSGTSTCTLTSTSPGSYTVTVTGTSGSLVHTATVAVTVVAATPPLAASFTFSPSQPTVGATVTFRGTATGGVPPYAFAWNFGDGATGSGANASHAYATNATFGATLTVTDSVGATASVTQDLAIAAVPPSVTTMAATGVGQTTATLEGDLTSTGGASQVALGFTYGTDPSLAGGTNLTGGSATAASPFAYTVTGLVAGTTYYVQAWADGAGFSRGSVASFATLPAGTPALVADFTYAPSSPVAGQAVAFSGSASGGTPPYAYAWSFGDGGTGSGPNPSHAFASGTYTVTLTVTDAAGRSVLATHPVDVAAPLVPGDPTATVRLQGTAGTGGWYLSTVTATFNATDARGSSVWVDAAVDGGSWANVTAPLDFGDGIHVVRYFAADGYGDAPEAVQSLAVDVDTVPPQVAVFAPASPVSSSAVAISWTGADPGSGIAGYAVQVDGGPWAAVGLSTGATLSLANGVHTVLVRAADLAGNTAVASVHLRVDALLASGTAAPWAQAAGAAVAATAAVAVAGFLYLRKRRGPQGGGEAP